MFPLADTAKERGTGVVTKLLITANVAVFGWELWLLIAKGDPALAGFVESHALVAQRLIGHPIAGREWLTLGTHMFLHGGILHLLGNIWFLWLFGGNVEGRLGAWRFLLLYLLSGVAAAGAQVVSGPGSAAPMIGASGAISGVLGAFLVLFPTAFVWTLIPWIVPIVPVPAVVFLILWFVLQVYSGLGAMTEASEVANAVAWWAHAGGFAAGVTMIVYAKRARWIRRR
jgi:membrane associated rhomboid family serine protease